MNVTDEKKPCKTHLICGPKLFAKVGWTTWNYTFKKCGFLEKMLRMLRINTFWEKRGFVPPNPWQTQ